MNIKLVALDMDGTLLQSGGILSEDSKKVLERCIQNKIHIVIASGRALHSLPEDVMKISGIEYAITSNGAAVNHLPAGKRIYSNLLTKDKVEQIMKVMSHHSLAIEAFMEGYAYTDQKYYENPLSFGAPQKALPYIKRTRIPVPSIHEFIDKNIERLDNIDIIVDDPIKKEEVRKELFLLEDLYVTSSVPHILEVANKSVSKAEALKYITQILELHSSEIMACGNADNDAEMITYAGIGVAVENSSENLLKAADFVTDSNDHEGVSKAIHKFVFDK